MARKGDGLYLRGTVWYLDFRHRGKRNREPLGSDISRTVARELATIKRALILKGEAGMGRKKADIAFTPRPRSSSGPGRRPTASHGRSLATTDS